MCSHANQFNLILEAMIQEAMKSTDCGIQVYSEPVNNLRFADDIDLIAESQQKLQKVTDKVNESSKRFGLKINAEKTKVMVVGQKNRHIRITLKNEKLEQVEEFTYLGSVMSADGKCAKVVKKIISLKSAMVNKFSKLWRSTGISNETKVKLYETFVVPVCCTVQSVGA